MLSGASAGPPDPGPLSPAPEPPPPSGPPPMRSHSKMALRIACMESMVLTGDAAAGAAGGGGT